MPNPYSDAPTMYSIVISAADSALMSPIVFDARECGHENDPEDFLFLNVFDFLRGGPPRFECWSDLA